MSERYQPPEEEVTNTHYADVGAHRARHDYWREMRRLQPELDIPDKIDSYIIRRTMLRVSRTGK